MRKLGQSLSRIVENSDHLQQVQKSDLRFGDLVHVKTLNSDYAIRVLENGYYSVSGGWFDHQGLSPMRLRITGCTWGGSIIKLDIVAACGLCLEFSNRVITSPIDKVFLTRGAGEN